MKKEIIALSCLSLILSGCVTVGGQEVFGPSLVGVTSNKQQIDERNTVANVDVDTAAARLKRFYKFRSETEVQQLNNGSGTGAYREAAARSGKYVWSAQPGSSYKMGRDFPNDLSVQLEVVKDGANRSKIYAKFWHINGSGIDTAMNTIKAVAEGRK